MDWDFDGEEFDEESKLRAETRKILELPELPISVDLRARAGARRPHRGGLGRDGGAAVRRGRTTPARHCARASGSRPSRTRATPSGSTTCSSAACVADETVANGLVLFVACDNLRKGAALNAIQIAELLLERRASPPEPPRAAGRKSGQRDVLSCGPIEPVGCRADRPVEKPSSERRSLLRGCTFSRFGRSKSSTSRQGRSGVTPQ